MGKNIETPLEAINNAMAILVLATRFRDGCHTGRPGFTPEDYDFVVRIDTQDARPENNGIIIQAEEYTQEKCAIG